MFQELVCETRLTCDEGHRPLQGIWDGPTFTAPYM